MGQTDREDRLATGADLGDARAFLEGDLDPRPAGEVDDRAEGRERQERPHQAEQDEDRKPADERRPSPASRRLAVSVEDLGADN